MWIELLKNEAQLYRPILSGTGLFLTSFINLVNFHTCFQYGNLVRTIANHAGFAQVWFIDSLCRVTDQRNIAATRLRTGRIRINQTQSHTFLANHLCSHCWQHDWRRD
jgi:hypothetical protein